ncbi:type I-E CRISPR-associated protein Cas6/Cse3/CasE [Meiothermus sp.]|uniref:type I-E CRISPR-associated protein Cas6/Cse3/CasE n=1 Tax=Meiothermus sp. TaxID=1955249 RepID=UPI0021DE9ACB|nr:type I-E CRISPR-associated protein Cas6/Cse3/CasE [Meiothermus sp.]GIW33813.1 MAG: CRISPR-associated endoribonuclease Cse3 [Meiothermus sp.]
MYLSRLQLDPRSKQARTDLANPYQLHATLCWAFRKAERPAEGESEERGRTVEPFLWRLEAGKTPIVLVQSAGRPNWDKLNERFPGYFQSLPEYKPLLLEHLQPAQTLRFRLKANPTVTKQGKRHGLKGVEEQLEWLSRQGEKGGFAVLGAMVAQSERVKMVKHSGGPPIVVQSVLYEGYLKIADLEVFKRTLATGLGHAKALGFGLLSIAKVSR